MPRSAVALLVCVSALMSSCVAVPEPSASVPALVTASIGPSPTADPTVTAPAPSASPVPPTPGPIVPGGYAQAPEANVPLHDRPLGAAFTEVRAGSDLWVLELAGGWALVEGQDATTSAHVFGWAAAADLVEYVPFPCDRSPEIAWSTAALHPQRALECQERAPLVLDGYAVEGPHLDQGYVGEPSWLAETPPVWLSSTIGPAAEGFWVPMHLPPGFTDDVPMSDREGLFGTLLRVTGHYDDPASAGCARTPSSEGYPAMDAERSELWCRQQLVVDSIEVVDPG